MLISISKSKSKTIQYLYNVKQKNPFAKAYPNEFSRQRTIYYNIEIRYLDLTENRQKHPTMNLDTSVLVLYSNVFNDITDEEIEKLDRDFQIVKEARKAGIYFRIYRKK